MATFIDTDGKRRTVGASAPGPAALAVQGSPSIATTQKAVTTAASKLVSARAGRTKVTITPTSAVVFYVGPSGVTASTGLYVAAGATVTLDTAAEVWAVGAAAVTLTVIEFF
jgi:hypothetical protein